MCVSSSNILLGCWQAARVRRCVCSDGGNADHGAAEMCELMGCKASVALSMYPKGYPIDPDDVKAREAKLLQGQFQP